MQNRMTLAHRVAYELAHGAIPEGMLVCHRCDVRACVKVEHLFLGTCGDNLKDAARKGRTRNGNSGKTHCHRGHEFTANNILLVQSPGRTRPGRACRACLRINRKKRDASQRKGPPHVRQSADYCYRGHPFTPENTVVSHNGERTYRTCRICRRDSAKRYAEAHQKQIADYRAKSRAKKRADAINPH